ncbi:leucine-rich repeat protein [Pumilibacter muris]|uniref:leucine-rich repeat protein n=1 Tax=Pumilibacter muris TaxID=2941510 RepID=UPI0020417A8C|nr:leucine-rich repeat protein [Pumilibacter muris]
MTKKKRLCASLVMVVVFAATAFSTAFISPRANASPSDSAVGSFTDVTDKYGSLALETEQFAESVKRLSDIASKEKYVTLIASLDEPTVLDAADGEKVADIVGTAKYNDTVKNIKAARKNLLRSLKKAKISYTIESEYDTVLAGVAVNIATEDFERCEEIINGMGGKAIVSETYYAPKAIESSVPNAAPASSGVTENNVKVYDTGIFDSSDVEYKGDGVVVAVLDSGFDYTHPVFTESVPPKGSISMDYNAVASSLGSTNAAKLSSGLTASDVYVSDKIPFAYDYADKDSDVYPLESNHGTHVASIIAGKSTTPSADGITITGVAPNAQLVLMKVFSDTDTGAKASWLLNALDDSVKLGVDVINMSLGSSAGFASEDDEKGTDEIYDSVREAGISLITAASNSYNSTFGSEANGNLPLTSNPDSGTVGSPSTYESALSVASISGVKTPYLMFGSQPIYYYEANNTAGEAYNFMDMMLKGSQSGTFEYVTVPGIGDSPSYIGMDVKGKIALVRRGKNTFEEKVQAAYSAGASGVIIYNNISGDIRMSVGNYLYDWGIGCISMSQDDGEKLAATSAGKITLSKENLAGPFMSDFSSWGPTASLGIKPEITAHGGDILAAVPGGYYDRLSGTSMASPNQAGVHALVRQYAKEKLGFDGKPNNAQRREIAKLSNQLLMSTTDIAYNEFGNPYSVRKQGAGLANLYNAVNTGSYLYVKDGDEELDRTKLELGDDPEKSGVYTLKFTVKNISNSATSFDVEALVYTESVSSTLTDKDETVSSERAYMLSDTSVSVSGNGVSGKRVTVAAGGEVELTVVLTLSKAAKDYLDASFENGMYVEGFVRLLSTDGGVNLSAPFLAFYGDWTQAPIFDLTYFETNPDEINDAIDDEDKIKPDAWATRPIAGLSKDYIGYMGGYYWVQNPEDVQIPAQEEHIALTNHENGLNSIYAVWAGLLRNAKEMDVTITDTVTGRQIYKKTETNQRKSYNYGSMIGYSSVDVKFDVADYNLKNNTQYTVRLDARLEYERDGADTNLKNSYEFTFTTDFEAPKITDVRYYSEYDDNTKETTYYADIDVYDNHYAQAVRPILFNSVTGLMQKEYFEPVYGSRNSTSTVTLELNDYIANMRAGNREFIVFVYDYAMNSTAYSLTLPQNIEAIAVEEENVTLSVNETKRLQPLLYPEDSFDVLLDYRSSNENVARVVNGTVLGVSKGTATITVSSKAYADVKKTVNVTVLGEGDDGYRWFDRPAVNSFSLLGFNIDFAYYTRYSDEISVGKKGTTTLFDTRSRKLDLYPGEIVSLFYDLQAYYPNVTDVVFTSGNTSVASVDAKGKIRALRKGRATITASVWIDGEDTRSVSASVDIEVQDPYVTSGAYLTAYKGIGENLDGRVEIPAKLNLTTISQFAFSLSQTVDKAPEDITEEDPYYTTSGPVGEQRIEKQITEVVIPEGVELIDQYAFANMTALKKVYLPKSLRQINAYAFQGCKNLTHVVGLENVKIISHNAFNGCSSLTSTSAFDTSTSISEFKLTDAIAIGTGAFRGTAIKEVLLPKVESAGASAFENCKNLTKVTFGSKIKIDASIFAGCNKLTKIEINSPVISEGAFDGCSNLTEITLGKDVAEVGAYAFAGTKISSFKVADGNAVFTTSNGGRELLRDGGKTLVAVAPIDSAGVTVKTYAVQSGVEKIGLGAFSSVQSLQSVTLPENVIIDGYAFYGCEKLDTVKVENGGSLGDIGDFAFAGTAIKVMPSLGGSVIGAYAFAELNIASAVIPAKTVIKEGAFFNSPLLASVEFGQGVEIGSGAFQRCASLTNIKFAGSEGGDKTTVGNMAFYGCGNKGTQSSPVYSPVTVEGAQYVSEFGEGAFAYVQIEELNLSGAAKLGALAFAGNKALVSLELSALIKTIGDEAFYGASALNEVIVSDGVINGVNVGSGAFCGTGLTDFAPFAKAEKIGDYAFAFSKLSGNVNLTEVGEAGIGAFAGSAVQSATLKQGKIAAQLFSGARNLVSVSGFENVTEVGAQAFAGTSISSAKLTSAKYVGRLAFANNEKLVSVELGENIEDLGDNPFALTNIPMSSPLFSRDAVTDDAFARPYKSYNFDFSETVKVIDGALYVVVPNGGLELIAYSRLSDANSFTVAEGTVRVSDYAAAGNSSLITVNLPYTLKAVGHAAFAACENLRVVNFGSINAPMLEAEYDETYVDEIDSEHVANSAHALGMTGSKYAEEYFSSAENVLFNNNFVSYVGITRNLTMTYPKNGVGYDSYVIDNYFDFKIIGAVVADDVTRNVIALINDIPKNVTLAHEEQIMAARRAFNQISDKEQSALVTNLSVLENAEKRIQSLKDNNGGNKPEPPAPVAVEKGLSGGTVALVVVVIILGAALIATVTLLLLPIIKKRVLDKSEEGSENSDAKKEEQSVRAEEKTQETAEPEKVAEVPATEPETHGNEAAATVESHEVVPNTEEEYAKKVDESFAEESDVKNEKTEPAAEKSAAPKKSGAKKGKSAAKK